MKKKILLAIGIIILAIIFIGSFVFLYKFDDLFGDHELDYSLIFNSKYYADFNPDVEATIGDNEKDLMDHFKEYGMAEGRKASLNFDVNYYKDNNEDLYEKFGTDLKQYYLHYMEYGHTEGRQGSIDDVSKEDYDIDITCELSTDYALRINMSFGKEYQLQRYYLFEMPAYDSSFGNAQIVSTGLFQERVILSNTNLTDKYVVCIKENGSYKQVSNFAYIRNPEINCTYKVNESSISIPLSKKGLNITENDEINYIEELNPSFINVDFYLDELIVADFSKVEKEKLISYDYNGNTYYYNQANINALDDKIKYYNDLGVNIIANILLRGSDAASDLHYPDLDQTTADNADYLAIDTSREGSEQSYEAFMNFIAKRYNGDESSKGVVSRWIIGSKVNLNSSNNYMGEKDINEYVSEYLRTFTISYNSIKANNRIAKVYVPIEKWWEIKSDKLNYSGREFLSCFNSKIKASGNIDWDLVYSIASYPASDPDYLNDNKGILSEDGITEDYSKVAIDNFDTFTITMKNISVLTEYLNQDVFLNSNNEARSLIIMNNGITSNSPNYGVSESKQASEMLYAYYRAELNDTIDAIMFTSLHDNQELLKTDMYSSYGLLYKDGFGTVHKKLAYDLFKTMDYKENVDVNDMYKNILDINASNFSDIIPEYNSELLKMHLNNYSKGKEYNNFVDTNEISQNNNVDSSNVQNDTNNENLENATANVITADENTNDNNTNGNDSTQASNEKIDISNLEVTFKDNIDTFKYSGQKINPEINVLYNTSYLVNDQDFDYTVYNNENAGTGKIVLVGINSFKGIKIIDFNIN